jgi:hypothetical protein
MRTRIGNMVALGAIPILSPMITEAAAVYWECLGPYFADIHALK